LQPRLFGPQLCIHCETDLARLGQRQHYREGEDLLGCSRLWRFFEKCSRQPLFCKPRFFHGNNNRPTSPDFLHVDVKAANKFSSLAHHPSQARHGIGFACVAVCGVLPMLGARRRIEAREKLDCGSHAGDCFCQCGLTVANVGLAPFGESGSGRISACAGRKIAWTPDL
jgi:hypothetical protein